MLQTSSEIQCDGSSPLLWLMISMVPYCSIHNLPTITLCTQQLTLDQVNVSFHLQQSSSLFNIWNQTTNRIIRDRFSAYFNSSMVSVPFGWISMLLPQNLILGWIEPWKRKTGDSAWNADTGGWWLTCSQTILIADDGERNSSHNRRLQVITLYYL